MNTREKAIIFLKRFTEAERNKIRQMLVDGILIGVDYAKDNEISHDDFQAELGYILEVKNV